MAVSPVTPRIHFLSRIVQMLFGRHPVLRILLLYVKFNEHQNHMIIG